MTGGDWVKATKGSQKTECGGVMFY